MEDGNGGRWGDGNGGGEVGRMEMVEGRCNGKYSSNSKVFGTSDLLRL